MTKIYIIVGIIAAIFFAYIAGGRIATEQCRADIAEKISAANFQSQIQIIKTRTKINEEAFNRGVRDIRNSLRDRYSIAE